MTPEQTQEAILQTMQRELAATQATGILLTRIEHSVLVLVQLVLVLVFLAALRRWGR